MKIKIESILGDAYVLDMKIPKNRNPKRFIDKWIAKNLQNIKCWEMI